MLQDVPQLQFLIVLVPALTAVKMLSLLLGTQLVDPAVLALGKVSAVFATPRIDVGSPPEHTVKAARDVVRYRDWLNQRRLIRIVYVRRAADALEDIIAFEGDLILGQAILQAFVLCLQIAYQLPQGIQIIGFDVHVLHLQTSEIFLLLL